MYIIFFIFWRVQRNWQVNEQCLEEIIRKEGRRWVLLFMLGCRVGLSYVDLLSRFIICYFCKKVLKCQLYIYLEEFQIGRMEEVILVNFFFNVFSNLVLVYIFIFQLVNQLIIFIFFRRYFRKFLLLFYVFFEMISITFFSLSSIIIVFFLKTCQFLRRVEF